VKPALRRWRRLRRWLLAAVACVLVGTAGLMALGRLLVPWLVDSPETVASWLGDRIGREVGLDSVDARWSGPGPLLDLGGLRISGSEGEPAAITLGRVRVQVDVYALLLPGRHLIRDFLLVDARVELVREVDGRIALEGFAGNGPSLAVVMAWLGRVGRIGVTGGQLELIDRATGGSFALDQVEMRLGRHVGQLRLGLERRGADGSGKVRLVLEHQGAVAWPPEAAEIYLEAERFPASDLGGLAQVLGVNVRQGVIDGRQWLGWRNHRLDSLQGEWQVEGLVLGAPGFDLAEVGQVQPNLHLPSARVVIDGQADADGVHIDLRAGTASDGDDLPAEISMHFGAPGWRLAASEFPLEFLSAAAQLAQTLPAPVRARVYTAQPRGVLSELRAAGSGDAWQWHAQIDALNLRPAALRWPAIAGLDLVVSADPEGMVLQVAGDQVEIAIPGVLRAPIALQSLNLLAGVQSGANGAVVEVPHAGIEGEGFAAELALHLVVDPGDGPHLTAAVFVPEAQIEAAKAFWFINKMPPRAVAWLDRALGAGRITEGRAVFRGPLRGWPFAEQQGRFEAQVAVDDAAIDYHQDWPAADRVSAQLAFINAGMLIDQIKGELVGNRVVSGRGGIPSFRDPVLSLDLAGAGDAGNWLQFLKASPLRRSRGEVLFGMSMQGHADVAAKIGIPLRKDLGNASVAGSAVLDGVDFVNTNWDLQFDGIRGRADFSDAGFAADRLSVLTLGQQAEVRLAVGAYCADPGLEVEASMNGNLSAQALFGQHHDLAPILARIEGSSEWNVDLKVHRDAADGAPAWTEVRYASELEGTAIQFPAPLGKPAEQPRAVQLRVKVPGGKVDAPSLRLDIGEHARLFAVVGTADSEFRGQLQMGAEQAQDLPSRGLRVAGASAGVDLAGWAGWILATTTPSGGEPILTDIDLMLGGDQQLRLDRSDGPWVLRLDGPSAQGFVRFESAGDRPAAITAQFERLYLPEPGDGAGDLTATPAMVPTLHLWVRDLRVGNAQLGEARLEAYASDTGLRVDLLEARSADLEIHASGDWLTTPGGGESRFKIRMLSEDLGRMLKGLGFAGVIAGGQTLAVIEARWHGAPHAFALERLNGSIDVSVGQGRFLDVDPGAGRIFGLLSLRELPRRLTLDFRDLFQSGMSFDRIEGRFQLADGNAWTEDLTVRGPAADLLIIGRTGLSSRDYDQQVMVAPHVSGVLPVLGVLAAGPVGAAAGFLAQGMVQQGSDIESSSRVHYSIAGSWEKPVVARLTPMRPDAPPRRRPERAPGGAG
jgi:uncharacterized protein (TIGR02099 family)